MYYDLKRNNHNAVCRENEANKVPGTDLADSLASPIADA